MSVRAQDVLSRDLIHPDDAVGSGFRQHLLCTRAASDDGGPAAGVFLQPRISHGDVGQFIGEIGAGQAAVRYVHQIDITVPMFRDVGLATVARVDGETAGPVSPSILEIRHLLLGEPQFVDEVVCCLGSQIEATEQTISNHRKE